MAEIRNPSARCSWFQQTNRRRHRCQSQALDLGQRLRIKIGCGFTPQLLLVLFQEEQPRLPLREAGRVERPARGLSH